MLDLSGLLPPGYRFRELWLPELINGTSLPSSISGGHPLTLTGAKKGSTANGVHFIAGVATSNVKFTDPYDAVNDWWCSIRFKLDQPFASGDTDQYLIGKYDDATNYLIVWLDGADGKLKMEHREGNGAETIVSAEPSWNTGWHNVLVSCSTTNGQRLIIDGGTPVTEPTNTTAISLTADICIGARDDGTSTEGLAGVIADVFMGNDILSTDEETLLYNGMPPADVVNEFLFDEGRDTTTYDRGSGADNGTLDTSCTWDFDARKLVALGLDAINDYAVTGVELDISGDLSLVWVGKMKSTHITRVVHCDLYIDGNNYIVLYAHAIAQPIALWVYGDGTLIYIYNDTHPSIDDYWIFVATVRLSGEIELFLNGSSLGRATGLPPISGAAARAYIGVNHNWSYRDISKPLLIGLIDGALSTSEAKELSRLINKRMGLGLNI